MNESGYFLVHRQLWAEGRNPHLDGQFSKREAWVYLIGLAAFQKHGTLGVGEFFAPERELAEKWKWSRSMVQRFLRALADDPDPMIELVRAGTTGRNGRAALYRIRNYHAYQNADVRTPAPAVEQTELIPDAPSPIGEAVGRFLRRHKLTWPLSQSIGDWSRSLGADARYAGLDIARAIDMCAEWWEGQRKKPRAPHRAIRNWLDNEVKYAPRKNSDDDDFAEREARRLLGGN